MILFKYSLQLFCDTVSTVGKYILLCFSGFLCAQNYNSNLNKSTLLCSLKYCVLEQEHSNNGLSPGFYCVYFT